MVLSSIVKISAEKIIYVIFLILIIIIIIISVLAVITKEPENNVMVEENSTQEKINIQPIQVNSERPKQKCYDDNGKISTARQSNFYGKNNFTNYYCPPVCNDKTYNICDGTYTNCCKTIDDKQITKPSECNFGEIELIPTGKLCKKVIKY